MSNTSHEFYGQKWLDWDEMKAHGPAARHTWNIILRYISKLEFLSVIDIGCGNGFLLQQMHSLYPSVKFSGTEYSELAIHNLCMRLPEMEFQYLDLSRNFIDQKYDLVICADVLEHIDDDEKALMNLRNMTGRYAIIAVPLGRLSRYERQQLGHVHGYSFKEFRTKVLGCGFTLLSELQWGFPFYNLNRWLVSLTRKGGAEGNYDLPKIGIAKFLFYLYKIYFPFWGGRYFILCQND